MRIRANGELGDQTWDEKLVNILTCAVPFVSVTAYIVTNVWTLKEACFRGANDTLSQIPQQLPSPTELDAIVYYSSYLFALTVFPLTMKGTRIIYQGIQLLENQATNSLAKATIAEGAITSLVASGTAYIIDKEIVNYETIYSYMEGYVRPHSCEKALDLYEPVINQAYTAAPPILTAGLLLFGICKQWEQRRQREEAQNEYQAVADRDVTPVP